MRTLLTALSFLMLFPGAPDLALAGTAAREAALGPSQDQPTRYVRYKRIRRVRRSPARPVTRVRHPRRESVDPRFSVYLGVGGLADFNVRTENDLTRIMRTGGGLDVFLGARFSRYLALEVGYVGTFHTTEDAITTAVAQGGYDRGILHGVTVDAKIFLVPRLRRFEPFVQVGGGGYAFVRDGTTDAELGGGGFHAGGGLDIRFNPAIAVGFRALYKGLYLDNSTPWFPATDAAFFSQITLGANLQLHF
ncbi:MAG: outer membrane beta-barrel protein [Deltaproteobacteria bacterium]|nr:outer membrane beta-barrel protein [Deltaproteobacteria bacterium]